MHELEHVPFLFSGTVFFGAIKEERDGKTMVKDRVLGERKPGNNCEMNKNEVYLALKCLNLGPLCLGKVSFTLAKGPGCRKTQGPSPWQTRGHAKWGFRFTSAKEPSPRRTRGVV